MTEIYWNFEGENCKYSNEKKLRWNKNLSKHKLYLPTQECKTHENMKFLFSYLIFKCMLQENKGLNDSIK